MRRMFDHVTETWNPVTGCKHDCVYCWAKRLASKLKNSTAKYRQSFEPKIHFREFRRVFNGGFVFVTDMGDLFGEFIPDEWIESVINHIRKFPRTTFLFLTKNPARYKDFDIPENVILGATIETDLAKFNTPAEFKRYEDISKAPLPRDRIKAMGSFEHAKFLSVEPILDFSENFVDEIERIDPDIVYVGYDNYHCKLPEPTKDKTLNLVRTLESMGFNVVTKTIRRAWYERTNYA